MSLHIDSGYKTTLEHIRDHFLTIIPYNIISSILEPFVENRIFGKNGDFDEPSSFGLEKQNSMHQIEDLISGVTTNNTASAIHSPRKRTLSIGSLYK